MKKKIIFLRYLPLTKKIQDDYCFIDLIKQGYELEYCDISDLFDYANGNVERYETSLPLKYVRIDSYKAFTEYVRNNKDALYWTLMTLDYKIYRIWATLCRNSCRKITFSDLAVPFGSSVESPHWSAYLDISKFVPRLINIYLRIRYNLNSRWFYDYLLLAGTEGWRNIGVSTSKAISGAKICSVHSRCYNDMITYKEKSEYPSDYILFVDQYLPLHPDNVMSGVEWESPEAYYEVMNSFFDSVEEEYGMPVIIAAHPKALKYKDTNYFGGRSVIFDDIIGLIRNSRFVLIHNSTSLAYALMLRKDVACVWAECIEKADRIFHKDIVSLSDRFCLPLLSADAPLAGQIDFTKDAAAADLYEKYHAAYLTDVREEDMHRSNGELFTRFLSEIY